jgi:hypothetical protein
MILKVIDTEKLKSKKLRFEVFKRDGFTCQYCGNTPPAVVLEVDHIQPKSKGGTNDINNLTTSCFDCNRGKAANELTKIPKTLKQNKELIEEKELQYKEYKKLLDKVEKRFQEEVSKVNFEFASYFKDRELSDKFKKSTLKIFLKKLPINEVIDAMNIACDKFYEWGNPSEYHDAIKYFCGICWNKIKNKGFNNQNLNKNEEPEKKESTPPFRWIG